MERTTIHLGAEDRAAIEAIKRRYGVTSASGAIRLALRIVASMAPPESQGQKK